MNSSPHSQGYQLVVDDSDQNKGPDAQSHRKRSAGLKFYINRVLVLAVVMYAAFTGFRAVSRSAFGSRVWQACHGLQRNLTTGASLPSHYQLPSGDRIPAVALGTVITASHARIVNSWP